MTDHDLPAWMVVFGRLAVALRERGCYCAVVLPSTSGENPYLKNPYLQAMPRTTEVRIQVVVRGGSWFYAWGPEGLAPPFSAPVADVDAVAQAVVVAGS